MPEDVRTLQPAMLSVVLLIDLRPTTTHNPLLLVEAHLLDTLFPLSLSTTLDFSMLGVACRVTQ